MTSSGPAPARSKALPLKRDWRRLARDFRVVVVVGLQLILASAAGVGVWELLAKEPTERRLILLAGLAGVVGGSLGPLLRPLARKDATDRAGTSLALSPLIYASAGFALAVGAYVAVRGLLVRSGPESLDEVGVVAFGGIIGWAAAQIVDGISARALQRSLRGDIRRAGEMPAVVTALGQLDEQLFGRPLQNYDGFLAATWHAPEPDSSLGGKVRVRFVPRVGPGEDLPDHSLNDESATVRAHARVLVQGGADVEEAVFSLSVMHRGLEAYPRRVLVHAPVGELSEQIEFTTMAAETSADADEGVPDVALVEVSQEGQTIQLVELHTRARNDEEA